MANQDNSAVHRIAIRTDDGLALRAECIVPVPVGTSESAFDDQPPPPNLGIVVCHPHPLHGGNMFNPVVETLWSGVQQIGLPAIRFNFRGTNGSEGQYQDGVGEQLDAQAAVEWLHSTPLPGPAGTSTESISAGSGSPGNRRIVLAGYSFGADVALRVDHRALVGWIAVAPPLTMADSGSVAAASDQRPTLILSGSADQFRDAAATAQVTDAWQNTTVAPLQGADHFLASELSVIEQLSLAFLSQLEQI